ncbi:pleckstrin homology-like domain family B member 3 isoform X2 [Pleurodeles waltl]|uniref:pleckstrin homology-like domain family B member 3 isoform X2 n=1 Tax=Pleurodeles waltl TaxID=8319 RepID=UPI003709B987
MMVQNPGSVLDEQTRAPYLAFAYERPLVQEDMSPGRIGTVQVGALEVEGMTPGRIGTVEVKPLEVEDVAPGRIGTLHVRPLEVKDVAPGRIGTVEARPLEVEDVASGRIRTIEVRPLEVEDVPPGRIGTVEVRPLEVEDVPPGRIGTVEVRPLEMKNVAPGRIGTINVRPLEDVAPDTTGSVHVGPLQVEGVAPGRIGTVPVRPLEVEGVAPGRTAAWLSEPLSLPGMSPGRTVEGQMYPLEVEEVTPKITQAVREGTSALQDVATAQDGVGQVGSSAVDDLVPGKSEVEWAGPSAVDDMASGRSDAEQERPTSTEAEDLRRTRSTQVGSESPPEDQEGDSLSSEACSSPGAATDSADDEEASSTESARNGEEGFEKGGPLVVTHFQEEQLNALAKISSLEQRIKELNQQKKELTIEMEMEGALLEGELRTEKLEMHREEEAIRALQCRLQYSERKCQAEREQEKARLQEEKRKVEELERRFKESQKLLDNQPECLREQLGVQIQEMSDVLEAAAKAFEDLEFQQLEKESSLEEERETTYRQITQEISEHQNCLNKSKRKILKLEEQLRQIKEQMEAEGRRLSEQKMEAIKDLHLEKDRLTELMETQNNGGKSFPGSPEMVTKFMFLLKEDHRVHLIGSDKCKGHTSSCLLSTNNLSICNSLKGSTAVQRTNSLPRRRGDSTHLRPADRPISLHGNAQNGVLTFHLANLGSITGAQGIMGSPSMQVARLQNPLYPLVNGVSNGRLSNGSICKNPSLSIPRLPFSQENSLPNIAEMERRLREALAEKERLLRARETKRAAQEEAKRKEAMESRQTTELPSTGPAPSLALVPVLTTSQTKTPVKPATGRRPLLDLKTHLEASGHSVETCSHMTVTATSCKGFLVKMGGRIKTWKKRWFVFDRQKRRLAYFVDKEEQKLKGVIYFQAIEEVYYDHLRSAFKSPHPKLTFCVKTYERLFCMVAPTAEALRIWMDVIVTAAEENARY